MLPDRKDALKDALENKRPFVFLSSLVNENGRPSSFSGSDKADDQTNMKLADIRKRIYGFNQDSDSSQLPVYVDECYHFEKDIHTENYNKFTAIGRILKYARQAEFIIFLLVKTSRIDNSGSSVFELEHKTEKSIVSYWELEFFQAAVTKKKVYFIAEESFKADRQIEAVLAFYQELVPSQVSYYPKDDFPGVVKELLNRQELPNTQNAGRLEIDKYLFTLNKYRFKANFVDGQSCETNLLTPFNTGYQKGKKPRKDLIEEILKSYSLDQSYEVRLAVLYTAYRELMLADYNDKKNSEYLILWYHFLNHWFDDASFYGLHGRTFLGIIPFLQDSIIVRARLNDVNRPSTGENIYPPIELQLAGEHYSCYSLTGHEQSKVSAYKAVEKEHPRFPQYNVRGHLYMTDRRYKEAIFQFEHLVKYIDGTPETDGKKNVQLSARSILSWARARNGEKVQIKEVEKLYQDYIPHDGERIRMLNRLADLYNRSGEHEYAAGLVLEAKKLGEEIGAYDQLNKMISNKGPYLL